MTQYLRLTSVSLGAVLLASAMDARAQTGRPARPAGQYSRSPVSPYLNLLRGGNPAINYYLGVRSEIELRNADAAIGQLQRAVAARPDPGLSTEEELPSLRATGHPTQFMNLAPYYYSPYFATPGMNSGSRAPAGQSPGVRPGRSR